MIKLHLDISDDIHANEHRKHAKGLHENFYIILFYDEKATTGCVLSKKAFLRISQNSQEHTSVGLSLLKKRFQTRCFFKNSFLHRTVSVAVSVLCFCFSHLSLFLSIYFLFLFFSDLFTLF